MKIPKWNNQQGENSYLTFKNFFCVFSRRSIAIVDLHMKSINNAEGMAADFLAIFHSFSPLNFLPSHVLMRLVISSIPIIFIQS